MYSVHPEPVWVRVRVRVRVRARVRVRVRVRARSPPRGMGCLEGGVRVKVRVSV